MKIVKSWKKNLKRTGALALATLVMCGGASFVGAENNITLNGINDTNNTINETGNEKTVLGYQTKAANGYAANITWGDMTFIYDRGTYDPKTGKLVESKVLVQKKDENGNFVDAEGNIVDETAAALVEKPFSEVRGIQAEGSYEPTGEYDENDDPIYSTTPTAGNWYGFDGNNNAVKLENLSTGAVEITATPNNTGAKVGGAEFNLYVFDDDEKTAFYSGSSLLTAADTQDISVSHSGDETYHGGGYMKCYYNNAVSEIHRVFAAATFNDDGSLFESDKDAIYLNISGKPAENLTTETTGEALGTITLSFKIVDGEGNVGDPLTPVVPVAEQGNQG